MAAKQPPRTFDGARTSSRIIWAAMSLSIVVYGAVIVLLSQGWESGGQNLDPVVEWALGGAGLVTALLSMAIHRGHFSAQNVARRAAGDEARAVSEMLTGHIVTWVQAETTAVCGFLYAFLSQQVLYYAPFALVSLTLFAVQFPSVDRYRRAFEEFRG